MAEAFERAGRITATSSSADIIRILTDICNRTVQVRLLTPQGIDPLRQLMREGYEFYDVAMIVYNLAISEEPGKVYSWKYVSRRLADGGARSK